MDWSLVKPAKEPSMRKQTENNLRNILNEATRTKPNQTGLIMNHHLTNHFEQITTVNKLTKSARTRNLNLIWTLDTAMTI